MLASYNGASFTYNGNGSRASKGSIIFTYDSDGRLIKQSNGLEFFYDNSGLAGLKFGTETLFYRKDVQGNIIALLDSNGAVVVKYVYDAWGNHAVLDANGKDVISGIGILNPFRYRGYYYDTETELYYLQTRYYDPELGRFISQDSVEYADPETVNGLNLYAYCVNNPVMGYDPNGTWNWAKWLIGGVLFLGAAILTVATGGALAPLFATMSAGILVSGLLEGAIEATSGGRFEQGFLNGAADGALWGGIFSFASASITAIKYASSVKGAVSGTKHLTTIQVGQEFDRYGSLYGKYLTEVGTPVSQLALPPTNNGVKITLQATRKFRVYVSTTAPAFGGTGGGVQYVMRYPIEKLLKWGWLIIIG
ncbi:MAG: glycohydrolase toxin TNT-related protein [Clostridia bacterium]|nr:glycohydrolase toxin TNT-related protein [Clostridia bacterium]